MFYCCVKNLNPYCQSNHCLRIQSGNKPKNYFASRVISISEEEEDPESAEAEAAAELLRNPAALTKERLLKMRVVRLRELARKLCTATMTRREIRFAKKEELVARILEALEE